MRRFPSSWDKTLSALGFRRNTKRIKRDHYRRKNRRIETLEVRAMLAGDTFVVTTLADQSDNDLTDGVSLREAIVQADAAGGANTITFDETLFAGGAKTLLLGDMDGNGLIEGTEDPTQLYVDSALTIEGPGSGQLTISGADDTRILQVQTNQEFDVSISGLTIAEGLADKGAGIYSHGNNLTLDDVTFSDNYAMTWDATNNRFVGKQGGALNFQGQDWLDHSTLTITNSTFDSNYSSHGGAIYSYGGYAHIEIDATTFSNNHAFYLMDDQLEVITTTSVHNGFGGALSFTSYDLHNSGNKGSIEIKNSTLHHNQAERDGGAIASGRSYFTLDIINSTISSNEAYRAGAIKVSYNQDVTILNSTITENSITGWSSSGGIDNQTNNPANLMLHNTIVAGNTSPSGSAYDLRGNLETASSHNLIGRWTVPSATPTGSDNQISDTMDPGLLPLGDYGGPTLTHGLEADSLAIDAGDSALAVSMASDQRGGSSGFSDRTVGELAAIDIGAFEYGATTIEVSEASFIASEAPFDVSTISGSGTINSSWVASNGAGDTVTVWRGTGAEGTGTYYSILNGTTQQLSQARLVDLGQDLLNVAPKVVIDGEGNFAISWLSYSQVDGSKSYWIRRYDSTGSPIDALPVQIAEFDQFRGYSISANESGRILVVWQDEDAVEGKSLYFRRFTTTGLSLDAAAREFFPSTTNDISLTTSGRTAVVKSDGGFYLTWHEAGEIRVAEFTPDGFQSGEATVIDAPTFESPNTGYVTPLDIALGPNDTAYVAWLRNTTVPLNATSSDSVRELLVAQVETGRELGNIANVQNVTSHDEWVTIDDDEWYVFEDYLHVERPSLSVDGLGRFGMAWERTEGWSFSGVGYSPQAQGQIVQAVQQNSEIEDLYEVDYIDRDVAVAWFDVNGAALQSAPIKVVNDAGESNRLPTLTSDASGNFVLTSQQSNNELWAQQFSLPKVVSLDLEGTLTLDDRAGQFEELSLGTGLIEGTQRVTFNGILTQFDASEVKKIVIYAGHGDNRIDLSRLETSHFNLQGSIDTNALSGPIEVYAGAGNDVLFAPAIGAVLDGEAGDDRLIGSDAIDVLIGGEGEDLLVGGAEDDLLNGGTDKDTLKGGEGDDQLYGGEGDDYLLGEAGADSLYGEAGNDRLDGGVADLSINTLHGGEGDDQFLLQNQADGVLGTSVILTDADGVEAVGIDTIDFSNWVGTTGVDFHLNTGLQVLNTTDGHYVLISSGTTFENVIGTPNDDTLIGNEASNRLEGREGNDNLQGAGGDDTLQGNSGDDQLYGGTDVENGGGGNDLLEGGIGDDTYYIFKENVISTVTINDAGGDSDTLDAAAASYSDAPTNSDRIISIESTDDQDLGNITIIADGLSELETLEGQVLPTPAPLPPVINDEEAPGIDTTSIVLLATEGTQWNQLLQLASSVIIPFGDTVFYTLGEDAPEGMTLDQSADSLSWTPGAGQEGDHTFTVYATRFGQSNLRTSTEITLTVANLTLNPVVTSDSLILSNPILNDTTTFDGVIEGELTHHDPLDLVDVLLTYTNGIDSFSVSVELELNDEFPYQGKFNYEPSIYELEELLASTANASVIITAVPRTFNATDSTYTTYTDISSSETLSITLDTTVENLATIASLELEHYTDISIPSTSDVEKVTTDPTFVGTVDKANASPSNLLVRFYVDDGDGVSSTNDLEIGKTRTDATGAFRFTPGRYEDLGFTTGDDIFLDVYAVVEDREILQVLGEETLSDPSDLLSFRLVKNTAPSVTLDTVADLSNSELTGSINWAAYPEAHNHEGVTIEFSRDGFVTVEGVAITDWEGNFSFLPAGLELGDSEGLDAGYEVTFSARAIDWDEYSNLLVISTIESTTFRPTEAVDNTPVAGLPSLKYPTLTTGEASTPTVTGTATKDGAVQAGIYVEYSIGIPFDSVDFEQADGFALTDNDGLYEFTPVGLELNVPTTIYVRAADGGVVVTEDTSTAEPNDLLVSKDWRYQDPYVSTAVTLVAASAPTISGLTLLYNTGADTTDSVTSDPTIGGQVTGYFGDMSLVTVEYMVNEMLAGELTPEKDGSFAFLAENYVDISENNELNEVRVRAIIPDFAKEAPKFDEIVIDGGDSKTIAEWLSEDYYAEADTTGLGWSDTLNEEWFNEVLADEGVGLQGDWYNSPFTRNWESVFDKIEGEWVDFLPSFALDATEASVPSATVLPADSSDPTNITITGVLTNVDNALLAGRTLEFYLNNNTEADGSVVTDENGEYRYAITSISGTSNDLVIKLVEPSYGGGEPVRSQAYLGTIDIAVDTDLLVTSLALSNPLTEAEEGIPATSIDPTLKGQIEKTGGLALQIIEFDYALNGIGYGSPDASTYTDALGGFLFQPSGIGIGASAGDILSVRSRFVNLVTDEVNNTTYRTIGSWSTPLEWAHVEKSQPEFALLQLEQDTGDYGLSYEVLDGVTSNPNLVGQVLSDGMPVAYHAVEFDHDGDGVVDAIVSTNVEGRFRYEPQGLVKPIDPSTGIEVEDWYVDIKARVVEQDINKGTSLTTGWKSVTRSGRPQDISSGVGFKLVPPDLLKVDTLSSLSATEYDTTITGTVKWGVAGNPGAANAVVQFFDQATGISLGNTTADATGNFTFVPVGLESGMTIVAKPVQGINYDITTLDGSENATVTATFTKSNKSVSLSLEQTDFGTVEISGSITASTANTFQPQYYEIRIGDSTNAAQVASAEIIYDEESGDVRFALSYELEYLAVADDESVYVRPVGYDDSGYRIGEWSTIVLPKKPVLAFDVDPVAVAATAEDPITEFQLSGEVADANTDGFDFNTNSVTWEYEIEYDLDGDGVADYTLLVENPSAEYIHVLEGADPDTYYLKSRVIGYGSFSERVVGADTSGVEDDVYVERTLSVEGEWIETDPVNGVTFVNPGPAVLVDNVASVATNVSHPVATEATIVGEIRSPLFGVDDSLTGMTVEVDENLDGYVDGSVYVQSDGTFKYALQDARIGLNTIQLRGVDPYSGTTNLEGDWIELTFTQVEEVAPQVEFLSLETYQIVEFQQKTDAPVIKGKVTLPANTAALSQWVEFDHDGDGTADGTALLDSFGNFDYTPTNLTYGEYLNFQVRTIIQLANQQLVGDWSNSPEYTTPLSLSFLYEPDDLPQISGDIEVLDVALGLIAGRATLNGFGYAGKIEVSVQQGGTEVGAITAYSSESGRFEFELLELTAGTYDLVITPQLLDSNANSGYYDGNNKTSRTESVNYSPIALNGTPELGTFGLAYNTGPASATTSDPTLKGTVNLSNYVEAPPQLYIEVTYYTESSYEFVTLPVRPDGTFEWIPPGLTEDNYQYWAKTKIWDPSTGAYIFGSLIETSSFELIQGENENPTISSLEMQFNEANEDDEVHVSADASFSGQITNDGRLGGHRVLFDHNQDGIIDGQTITLGDGSFFYRADGIEASDTLTQIMTAWVVETDYWGEELSSNSQTRDFKLTRAPIISEVTFNPSINKVEGSLFSEADPGYLWIEYEFFGASLPAGTPPADVYDYVNNYAGIERQFVSVDSQGNFEIDLPIGAIGNLSVVLRGVDSRNLDLTSTLIEDYDTLEYEDKAIKGIWRLASFDTNPTEVGYFRLLEDTGATDQITSNPTVAGTVRPFEVVEIKTAMLALVGVDYEIDSFVIDRITADGNGNFEFVSPAFQSTYGPSDRFEITAKTVSFDLSNSTESYGAVTSPVTFDYVENGTSISVSADILGLVTGTVSAHTTNGRVAGLRVELDLKYGNGQAYDGIADGYAITDANGDFSYQVYGFVIGEIVDVKAQVIEWNAAVKEFTDPAFVVTESTVDSTYFTADVTATADPSLSEEVSSGNDTQSSADLVLQDTVDTVLASIGELSDSGKIDLGVWSIDTLGRGGVSEAGPEGDGSDLVTIVTTSSVPLSEIDEFSRILENPELTGSLGSFDVSFSASRAWDKDGNNDDTLTTRFDIWLEEYNHTDDPTLEFAFANNSGTPTYSFQFVATGTKTLTDFEIDTYTTTETSSYDFYTEDYSYTPDGTLYRTEITAGSYGLIYEELNIPVASGPVDRGFKSTEITNLETWLTETDSDSSDGETSTLSDHSTYYERSVSSGTISAAGTTGTNTVDAQGFYESNFTSTVTTTNELTSQDSSGATLTLTDTSTDSLSDSYIYRGNLNTVDEYTVGGASNLTFNLYESITSSYNQSGSGTYERAQEDGSWNYSAGGSTFSTSTLNGKSYEGLDYSSVDATISSGSNQSHNGSGGGSSSYDETSSPGNSDIGTASNSYSYNLNGNSNANATLSSYNEDYAVQGTQSATSSANTNSSAEVDGTLLTNNGEDSSTNNYGTRIRATADNGASANTDFHYKSAGNSNIDGNFSIDASAASVVATQAAGSSSTPTTTSPFRDNTVAETSLTFTSISNFYSKNRPGEEEEFSASGHNTLETNANIKTTEYIGFISAGSATEPSINNSSLTKTEVKDLALEDYNFAFSNDIESRIGEFKDKTQTSVEVTESLVVINPTTTTENGTENSQYTNNKDSFIENISSSEGFFKELDGDSESFATLDESFDSYGLEKSTYSASGMDTSNTPTSPSVDIWNAYSSETVSYESSNQTTGFAKLENGETIDSIASVELDNHSIVNTVNNSSASSVGTEQTGDTTTSYNRTNHQNNTALLTSNSRSEGQVQQDGSSQMSVTSSEDAITSNNTYFTNNTTTEGTDIKGSSSVSGNNSTSLLRATFTTGLVKQRGETESASSSEVNQADAASSFDTTTSSTTVNQEFLRWNFSEATTDGADYERLISNGTQTSFSTLSELTDSTIGEDGNEEGSYATNQNTVDIEISDASSNGQVNGRSTFGSNPTRINKMSFRNESGTYELIDNELSVSGDESELSFDGTQDIKLVNGWRESSTPTGSDPSSSSSGSTTTSSTKGGFAQPKEVEIESEKYLRKNDGTGVITKEDDKDKTTTTTKHSTEDDGSSKETTVHDTDYEHSVKTPDSGGNGDTTVTTSEKGLKTETFTSKGNEEGDKQTLTITDWQREDKKTERTTTNAPVGLLHTYKIGARPGTIEDGDYLKYKTLENGGIDQFSGSYSFSASNNPNLDFGQILALEDLADGGADLFRSLFLLNEYDYYTTTDFEETTSSYSSEHMLAADGISAVGGKFNATSDTSTGTRSEGKLDKTVVRGAGGFDYDEHYRSQIDVTSESTHYATEVGTYNDDLSTGERKQEATFTIIDTVSDTGDADKNYANYSIDSPNLNPTEFLQGWDITGPHDSFSNTKLPVDLERKVTVKGSYDIDGKISSKVTKTDYQGSQEWLQSYKFTGVNDQSLRREQGKETFKLAFEKDNSGVYKLFGYDKESYDTLDKSGVYDNEDYSFEGWGGAVITEVWNFSRRGEISEAKYQVGQTPPENSSELPDFGAINAAIEAEQLEKERAAAISNEAELAYARAARAAGDPAFAAQDGQAAYDAEIDRVQDQIDYLSYVPGIGGAIADATNIVIDLNQGQYGSAGSRAVGFLGGELLGAAINGVSKGASAVGKGTQDLMKGADNAASSASKQAAKVAGRNADELASKLDEAAEALSKKSDDATIEAAKPVVADVPSAKELKKARQRGVNRAKSAERDLIKNGHPGTADDIGFTLAERKRIAETGQYPDDVRWHHINDVKNHPELADLADNVIPSRGGTAGHVGKYHPNGTRAGSTGDLLDRAGLKDALLKGGIE